MKQNRGLRLAAGAMCLGVSGALLGGCGGDKPADDTSAVKQAAPGEVKNGAGSVTPAQREMMGDKSKMTAEQKKMMEDGMRKDADRMKSSGSGSAAPPPTGQ